MSNSLKQDISIGKKLKTMRKAAGLTQDEAAAQMQIMGLPINADILAKIEQGKYSIRISVLAAMKKIYKVDSYDAFFEDIGE
ncbi:MAG: helix-turn-helix domain-containing protein [Clostridiales bacterium]|nr:helix-turn-helix domain-containing protein [Clostridiales bacterium]